MTSSLQKRAASHDVLHCTLWLVAMLAILQFMVGAVVAGGVATYHPTTGIPAIHRKGSLYLHAPMPLWFALRGSLFVLAVGFVAAVLGAMRAVVGRLSRDAARAIDVGPWVGCAILLAMPAWVVLLILCIAVFRSQLDIVLKLQPM
jgi:hypothetical protein